MVAIAGTGVEAGLLRRLAGLRDRPAPAVFVVTAIAGGVVAVDLGMITDLFAEAAARCSRELHR